MAAGLGVDGQQRDDPRTDLEAAGERCGQDLPPGVVQPLGALVHDLPEGLDDLVLDRLVGLPQLLTGTAHDRLLARRYPK